ncbi:Flp family type IVb pilin [bacterium]|nr:Flp family type IVb pilin [bacterium]NCQ55772.1 Flp family type IVb pilin [Candidatus Parcubacteria bacterium]NCS67721.1 Flp family type IVb pilin [Candidatus Peregrinibacteria bacterium]NCS96735.1 Flp family type IVb pilin [bacterium]
MKCFLVQFLNNRSGQALTEYALILAVIAIAVVAVMTLLGDQLQVVFQNVIDTLTGAGAETEVVS